MTTYLAAIGFISALFAGAILVDRLYRRFATRNPELGPFRSPDKHDCCACVAGSGCADKAAECNAPPRR